MALQDGTRQPFETDLYDGVNPVVQVLLPSIDLAWHDQALGLDQRYYHVALYGTQRVPCLRVLVSQGQIGLPDLDFALN